MENKSTGIEPRKGKEKAFTWFSKELELGLKIALPVLNTRKGKTLGGRKKGKEEGKREGLNTSSGPKGPDQRSTGRICPMADYNYKNLDSAPVVTNRLKKGRGGGEETGRMGPYLHFNSRLQKRKQESGLPQPRSPQRLDGKPLWKEVLSPGQKNERKNGLGKKKGGLF